MKLEFAYRAEDYIEASRAKITADTVKNEATDESGRFSRVSLRTALSLFFFGSILVLASCACLFEVQGNLWLVPAGADMMGLLIACYALVLLRTAWGIRRSFEADERSIDWITMEFDEAGMHLRAPIWKCDVEWQSLRLLLDANSVFVLIDDTPSSFVIPKRTFADDRIRESFQQMIRERMADGSKASAA